MPALFDFPTILLGDIHGNRTLLTRALTDLGLLDAAGHWCGGARRLIQLGDMIDRGPEPLDTLDLLMRLQREAAGAGGEVTCLLGNHELMALRAADGDHEMRIGWAYNGAGADLMQWAARRGATVDPCALPYPEEFFAEFSPTAPYGRWLRSLPVAALAGEYVAVHAGWTPDGPDDIATANAAGLQGFQRIHNLLWARRQPAEEIAAACARLGCRGLVAGHSVQAGIVTSAGGRLIQIDVGMYWHGTWAALGLAEDGRLWTLVEGEVPAPIEGDGLVPVPRRVEASHEKDTTPRFGNGDLLRIYRAADGVFAQYMRIEGLGEMMGHPAYTGRIITCDAGQWAARPSTYFCERIDIYGRPAGPDEIPADLL